MTPQQPAEPAAPDPSERERSAAVLLPLFLFLVIWLVAFIASGAFAGGPSGKKLGGDFAIFLGAAEVLKHGGNPYDRTRLYNAERDLLGSRHIPVPSRQSFIRVGNPPLVYWALEPLASTPFKRAATAWIVAMYSLLVAGLLLTLYHLGWPRRVLPLLIFLAMPPTVLAGYYGNVDGIVFASFAAALLLARRFPLAGGAVLTLAWLKPQVALPIVLLLFLFPARRPLFLAAGFAAGSVALLGGSWLAAGTRVETAWLQALGGYSHGLAAQPDIASLSGLYVYWAPAPLRVTLEVLSLLAALGLTLWWWRRAGSADAAPLSISAWLFVVWFLATPFAHFHDEVLLLIPLLALLGTNGSDATRFPQAAILYLLAFSLLLFPTSRLHTDAQSLALIPLAALAFRVSQAGLRAVHTDPAARRGVCNTPFPASE